MTTRRTFIAGLGAAAAWPLAARGQQKALPVIGFLNATEYDYRAEAFLRGLEEFGFVENQNVKIEYRWLQGQFDRLSAMAADLVRRNVDVIAASGSPEVALAAKKATGSIPIVFAYGGDPVHDGLVTSLSRPNQNITGASFLVDTFLPKLVQIIHEAIPSAGVIGYLDNQMGLKSPILEDRLRDAADELGLKLFVAGATIEAEFETAFATFKQRQVGAIVVSGSAYFNNRRRQLVALAERFEIPAIYPFREYTASGGLMSYGTDVSDGYRLMGTYVGRILKGEKAADLPVQQSTKVELVINTRTAKALGLTFPITLLGRADEVIE